MPRTMLALLLLTSAGPLSAQQASEDSGLHVSVEQPLESYCVVDQLFHERLAYLVGNAQLTYDPSAYDLALSCVLRTWKEARGAGPVIDESSDALIALMQMNPPRFFSRAAVYPAATSDWLAGLQLRSFTWVHGTPCQLDEQRTRALRAISDLRLTGRAGQLQRRVVARLKTLRCHIVR